MNILLVLLSRLDISEAMKNNKKVIVGLSGGVDSSVAALLLIQKCYDVEAVFMQNWEDSTGIKSGECHWEDDYNYAKLVAKQLGIKLHFLNLSREYKAKIVDYMFSEYEAGRTPNPDILCNREIKFDVFTNYCKSLGADAIATGHYAGISKIENGEYNLLRASDENKDQTYFLCQLNQEQLSTTLFPLENLTKPEIKEIAQKEGLASSGKKESMGLCFIGKVDLPTFLKQQIKPRSGKVIEISKETAQKQTSDLDFSSPEIICTEYDFSPDMGTEIGTHDGVQFYTIGQRKGLGIGGRPNPIYVLHIDNKNNIIYVGEGENHPLLNRIGLFIKKSDIHWIRHSQVMEIGEKRIYLVRFRHRQKLQKARLEMNDDGMRVIFDEYQQGISPGQFCVWYSETECLGSGSIF
jgi:tRNA-uridine 2-sulfurtransferase